MSTYGNITFDHRERNRILHDDPNTAIWIVSEIESMKIASFRIFNRKIKSGSSFDRLESAKEIGKRQFKKLMRMGLNVPVSFL